MPKKNNAQFSIEFIVLIAFMFLVFLGFISAVTSRIIEAKENERQQIAEDIAALARNEIDIAKSMVDGYARNFNLPTKIKGNSYTIEIIDNRELVVKYLDKEYVEFIPEKICGQLLHPQVLLLFHNYPFPHQNNNRPVFLTWVYVSFWILYNVREELK